MAERVIKTLRDQILLARCFPTLEAMRNGLAEFADLYNASWLRERLEHKTPDQIRGQQKALASEAARSSNWRHNRRSKLSHNRSPIHTLPSIAKPTLSICLRGAKSAQVTAKPQTPNESNAMMRL